MMKNNNLIYARKKQGLTQVEVAKKVGISVLAYQRYEYEMRIPKADVAIRIADVFSVGTYKDFKKIFSPEQEKNSLAKE